jgi:Glycosyl hydrolases family 43
MPSEPMSAFHNRETWPDTDGVHINAHGGGVIWHEGTYYWFGEARNPRQRGVPSSRGVVCYSSKDLYNWKNEVTVLPVVDVESSDITRGCIIERPKVIYNARTKQFVMWFHLELKGRGYGAARTALAVGDSPTKPFQFVRSLRPNAGKWSIEFPEQLRTPLNPDQAREMTRDRSRFRQLLVEGVYTRRDYEGGQMARDMTLFVDDDGKAYLIASAEENYTLNIHELTDDYTDFTGKWLRVVPGGHNEAPALIKHNGKYFMLASGCTGWDPNPARVLAADNIWGPWKNVGNPCVGVNPQNQMGPELTFGGQSTFILPLQGRPGAYIAMFDIWRPRNLIDSGYIWLPAKFEGDRMKIQWRDTWDLSVFGK